MRPWNPQTSFCADGMVDKISTMASSNALISVELGRGSIVEMVCIRMFTSCWLSGGGTIFGVVDGCSDLGAFRCLAASPNWALAFVCSRY